ncbi:MAG: hypothetical protein ABI402_07765 [Ferruginibacter sp.]
MKNSRNKKIKFIASLDTKKNKSSSIEDIAKILHTDGIEVNHVSSMLGYLSGNTDSSIEELQNKYQSHGISIEQDRSVGIK